MTLVFTIHQTSILLEVWNHCANQGSEIYIEGISGRCLLPPKTNRRTVRYRSVILDDEEEAGGRGDEQWD